MPPDAARPVGRRKVVSNQVVVDMTKARRAWRAACWNRSGMLGPRPSALPAFDHDIVVASIPAAPSIHHEDWRGGLPVVKGALITLRELRAGDARPLFQALTTKEVAQFISPPPQTVDAFEKFIAWTHCRRAAGDQICFAVVPRGSDVAIGVFQVRSLDAGFESAEWGFAIASE